MGLAPGPQGRPHSDAPDRRPALPDLDAEFPRATREQWRELVGAVLRKAGREAETAAEPEAPLRSTTYDGITIDPLYDAPGPNPGLPGLPPLVRGGTPTATSTTGWELRQLYAGSDVDALSAAIDQDLAGGADSLWLPAGDGGIPHGELPALLGRLDLARVPVATGPDGDAAEALLRAAADQGVAPEALRGGLGLDPLGVAARTGESGDLDQALGDAAARAVTLARAHPRMRALTVDAAAVHDAGGSEAQELGAAMAFAAAYLRALDAAGLAPSEAVRVLEFRFAANADQFLTIAKLRAARAMFNRVAEVCGVPESGRAMRQHAVSSAAMLTRHDPHVNILRTTVACLAAGLGGADVVTVRPHDSADTPTAGARRIARNVSAILLQESQLSHVIDPGGGSGYIEHLTMALRDAGWRIFQRIEADGTALQAVRSGRLAADVADTWERRRRDLATRRQPLTGVSAYPDLTEPAPDRPRPPRDTGRGLPLRRYARDFEALRDRSDAHLQATGHRPRVFLAPLGRLASHTARASFAAGLLAAGGIEAVNPGELGDARAAVRAFAAARTTVACLCGSDEDYRDQGAQWVRELREAGARRVLVAGASPALAADADDRLTEDGDAVALLTELCEELGVAR